MKRNMHPAPVAPGLRFSLLASISTAAHWSQNFAGLITFSSWLNHQTSSNDFGGMNPEICSVFGKSLKYELDLMFVHNLSGRLENGVWEDRMLIIWRDECVHFSKGAWIMEASNTFGVGSRILRP